MSSVAPAPSAPERTWRGKLLRPKVGDVVLACFLWFSGYGGLQSPGWQSPELPSELYALWSLGFVLPLVWRRTFPTTATLAIIPAHLLQLALMDNFMPANITAPVMIYAAARYSAPVWARRCLTLALLGCVAAGLDWARSAIYNPSGGFLDGLVPFLANGGACAAVILACWFAGQWARQKDLVHLSWRQRAESLERERAQGMALVAQEERNRLAREMHDIVAHSLSVIVVQSDGAGYLASHDELGDAETRLARVNQAIETIGQTARTALGETRRLVGVLRQDGEEVELAPAATLDQMDELVAQLQRAGVPASFTVEGDADAHPALSEGAQMALYRVVQESLTNVMKHAGPGATVQVSLQHSSEGISLRVADTGSGPSGSVDGHYGDGLGHGLVGMRERMAAWGGQLSAGPRPGGGFAVHAVLPHHPAPTPDERTS
ncbi:sensor histidine kinase [Luteococcus sp. OSA5]|uniref:sensor histidine kinase n=1 Tax=Luteococcus sp. OSA5 TaxID=3401630 RepID=UPI003B43B705